MKILFLILLAAAIGFGGYLLGRRGTGHEPAAATSATAPASERKVLYYHDPMFPQQKFDKPGKSPFMDMQLVPVYADSGTETGPGIAVSATSVQNLGVRTVVAELGTLATRLEAVGAVAWNERGIVLVQTRAAGFVEKLHARAPLDPVAKGAPLVEILFPEWAAAQEEFLLLRRRGQEELAIAARGRLVLLGMSETEIREVEQAGIARPRITLRSPISGIIAELGVREGMTVGAGATLFRLADLSTVWVNAEVPEAQAASLRPGATAEARVPGWPDLVFKGRLGAILPEVNASTRTLRVRIELANPGQRLKPGMFASVSISPERGAESVLVPSEAVIRTGERNVVIVAEGGRFAAAEVEVGREAGGRSEIRKGVKAGDRVVTSGQFLIDSEASLKGALSRLEGAAKPAAKDALHPGSGRVLDVDPATGRIELDHGPMPSIRWPAMSMGFQVADPKALAGIGKGDSVEFEMRGEPDKDGDYVIERLKKKVAK
jgi:Cu(I)/Ag(I) efflux system membrane fusion protein